MERSYYKVTDKSCKLFVDCSKFLKHEAELHKIQKETIEARMPKFEKYRGTKGFNRIVTYTGFVFEDPDKLDPKEWNTKLADGYKLSTPNKRTKKGKEILKFLQDFKRTNCWDVDALLNIEKQSLYGSFYPADLFKHNDTIYIFIDAQYRKTFEQENDGFIEITLGEMEKAINDYNAE